MRAWTLQAMVKRGGGMVLLMLESRCWSDNIQLLMALSTVHCPLSAAWSRRHSQNCNGGKGKHRKILTLSWLCRPFSSLFFCDIFAEGFCIRATFCGFCGCWHAAQRKRDVPWAGGPCPLVAFKFLRERLFCLCSGKKCENCKLLRALISALLRVSQLLRAGPGRT